MIGSVADGASRAVTEQDWESSFEPSPLVAAPQAPSPPVPESHGQAQKRGPTEAAAPFSSDVVHLPKTVPELVKAHERLYLRCEGMKATLNALRVQANHLASSSPSASAVLSDLLHIVADGDVTSAATPNNKATVSPRGGVSSAESTPRKPAAAAAAAADAAPHAAVTGSVVMTGKALATPVKGTAVVVGGAVVDSGASGGSSSSARNRLTRFVEDLHRDYKEDCNALRVQLMAMEAAQQLLAVARAQLQETENEKRQLQEELKGVQLELLEARATSVSLQQLLEGSSGDRGDRSDGNGADEGREKNPAAATEAQLARALHAVADLRRCVDDLTRDRDTARYHEVQLEESTREMERALRFANEKSTQLEGQLQRLLTAPQYVEGPASPQRQQALVGSVSSSARAPSGDRAQPPSVAVAATASSSTSSQHGVTAEAYQRAAFERQLGELRAIIDKQQRVAERNSEKRKKLEGVVSALREENTALKANALQYRRQVNESELDLEREASAKAIEERAKSMEKEVLRLRNALRDRRDAFEAKTEELEAAVEAARKQNKVYQASTTHLQRELLRCQLRLVALIQRGAESQRCPVGEDGETHPLRPGGASPRPLEGSAAPVASVPAAGPASSPLGGGREGAANSFAAATSKPDAASSEGAAVSPQGGSAAGGQLSAAPLPHHREGLEEVRQLFERRVETVEARRRAEVKQLQHLNKELRQALASSQEEVREANRLLELARAQNAGAVGSGMEAFAASYVRSPHTGSLMTGLAASHHAHEGPLSMESSCTALGATQHDGGGHGRRLCDVEQRYDPENMSVWEAVQLENEALLKRVSALQEEKWSVDTALEDAQRQNSVLQRELQRNAETMNQLLKAGVLSPAALQKGQEEGRIRSLQCLLQDTLKQKLALEEQVSQLTERLKVFQ